MKTFDSMSSRNKNIVNLFADRVTVYQDYSELIANYSLKILTMPNQTQVSHDFISVTIMHRDHESKGAALRHAVDEAVKKIKLKREAKSWL